MRAHTSVQIDPGHQHNVIKMECQLLNSGNESNLSSSRKLKLRLILQYASRLHVVII